MKRMADDCGHNQSKRRKFSEEQAESALNPKGLQCEQEDNHFKDIVGTFLNYEVSMNKSKGRMMH